MTTSPAPVPLVALVGGTGNMGSFILAELLAREIDVRAVVRSPERIAAGPHLDVAVADVFDTDELATAFKGADIVVSAFNPGWDVPDLYARYLRGSASVQDATRAAGVGRLLIIGGASSLIGDDGRELIESMTVPEPYASGVRAARDYFQQLRAETDLDWVFLSPPLECGPVGPVGRTGRYRLGQDRPVRDADGRNALSREDLAVAVADEVLHQAHHHQRFTVGY